MIYRVKRKELARHMVRQLFIIIFVGFTIVMLIRFVTLSFDIDETFKHVSLLQLPLIYLGIFLFSLFFGVAISFLLKCSYITIENNMISGRNYWLVKRRFDIEDIEKVFPFNSNGMPVVVVDAGKKARYLYLFTLSTQVNCLKSWIDMRRVHNKPLKALA